ncbi:HlyD family type I secretion periplasmic adaptor subunit [Bradyrhizobium sp. HKCCYLS2038]|uniref:HlyD family type I secretion periplasmic adaptor subunit n=1 Tax=unclassified Bradyrhizobium TaxID=2631580 RepID=UPI003EBA3BD1
MPASILALKPTPRPASAEAAVGPDIAEMWRPILIGLFLSASIVLTIFMWGSLAKLSGAVVARGIVVSAGSSKKIQHAQGGTIQRIEVRNGTRVVTGDLLVRLDDTQPRATLGIVTSQLIELNGRKLRLTAERDGLENLSFPPEFSAEGPAAANVANGETRLFQARLAALQGQQAQLRERIKQYDEERAGVTRQNEAKGHELVLIREELDRVNDLYTRNLLPITRVLSLQRDQTRIEGEIGTLTAQIARLGGQMTEANLQIIALSQSRLADSQKELRDIEGRIAELMERKIAAEDQLRHVELRSPIDGIVNEMSVHTIGGVVNPAEQLMLIVPSDDTLEVEVRIPSSDIEQLETGQTSTLRFTAFNQRTTPEVDGTVTRISPDASRDSETNQFYYTVRILPNAADLTALGNHKLLPGMPVDAFIQTPSRSALSYFIKPLADQLGRAFRER